MQRFTWTLVLVISTFLVTGCEDEKQTKLIEAQNCLNRASFDTALTCIEPIASQTSKRAYVLKCSARFLARGLDESKIASALEQIGKDESGTNPTSSAIANLAVPDSATAPTGYDLAFAKETLTACQLTESKGLTALASFSVISTATNVTIAGLVPGGCTVPYTTQCVTDGLDGVTAGSDATEIGNTAIENQAILCGESGVFKGEDFCTDLNNAVAAGGGADAVGDALLSGIANDNG